MIHFRLIVFLCFNTFCFTVTGQYISNGSANQTSCNCYQLTPANNNQGGSVWNSSLIDLNTSFDFTFEVFLGYNNSGADGIVFGLQPTGTNVGSSGGGLGILGVTPSVFVELDTYMNVPNNDPSEDHMAILKNGDLNHNGVNSLAAPITFPNIEDGQWHTFRIIWDAATTTITASLDGTQQVQATEDIINTVFAGNPNVYWGFTGATGGLTNEQSFCTLLEAEIAYTTLAASTCDAQTFNFADSSSSFGNIVSWQWDIQNDGVIDYTVSNPSHTFVTAGIYDVVLIITDGSGCTDTIINQITLNFLNPVVNLGPDTLICNNLGITLDGGLFDQYMWSTGETTQTIFADTSGTYILDVLMFGNPGSNLISNGEFSAVSTSWDACGNNVEAYGSETTYGGSNAANTNVAEVDPGTDGIAGTADDMLLCQNIAGLTVGQTYDLCFDYSRRNIGPNPMDMIVSINGGALNQTITATNNVFGFTQICFNFTATQSTHLLSFTPGPALNNGLGMIVDNVELTETPTSGCSTSDTIEIIIENPVQTITSLDPICLNQPTGEIYVYNPIGIEYSIDAGLNWQVDSFFINLPPGLYNVCSKTLAGCQSCEDLTIPPPLPVTIEVSEDTIICENGTANLWANSTGGNTYLYHWDNGLNTGNNQIVNPTNSTVYTVYSENENGCLSPIDSITVTVLPPLSGTISEWDTICPLFSSDIMANVSGGLGTPYSFLWSTTESQTGPDNHTITVSPTVNTTYSVIITDECESTPLVLETDIVVSELPVPQYEVLDPIQCEPAIFHIVNTTDAALNQFDYWWISPGQQYINTDTVTTVSMNAGQYDLQLVVTSYQGCTDSITVINALNVDPSPIANFGYSPNPVLMFNTEVTFINQSFNGFTYQWFFEDGYPSQSIQTNEHVLFPDGVEGSYDVMLITTSELGCQDTTIQEIIILPEVLIYAPNAFTPDGDEFNQGWFVHMQGIDIYDFELLIFNRWGEVVWESHDILIPWNGTYNGKMIQDGTYLWVIRAKDLINDNKLTYNGHVTVIR